MVDIPQLSDADIALLRRYDTPTVCNAIECFAIQPQTAGYMDARIRACFPELPPMVGYAATATFRSAAPPKSGGDYASLDEHVASFSRLPQPVVVVFQDLDDPAAAATFGEVMATAYQRFGAVGLVTSGAARDLDQVRALKFPCFSDGVICSHGYPQFVDIQVPVRVGGLTIHPGDLLHGDANGVTTIPHPIASAVARACEEYAAAEQPMLDFLRSGEAVTPETFGEARKALSERIRLLKQRYSAKP